MTFQMFILCLFLITAVKHGNGLHLESEIIGPKDVKEGEVIQLKCRVKYKNATKYTFYMAERNRCVLKYDLNKFTFSSNDKELNLRMNSSELTGKRQFACVRKGDLAFFGCHTLYIGRKPQTPTSHGCVVRGFEKIICDPSPSGDILRNHTNVILMRHKFKIQYAIYIPYQKSIYNQFLCCEDKCRCRVQGNRIIYDDIKDIVTMFVLEVNVSNIFGNSSKKFFVKVCEVEQPIVDFIGIKRAMKTSFIFNWNISSNIGLQFHIFEIKCTDQFHHTFKTIRRFSDFGRSANGTIEHLKPGRKYICSIRAQSRLQFDYVKKKCKGKWSEPQHVTGSTLPAAPSRGPVVLPGMMKKMDGRCYFYFLPIPREDRNGKVIKYNLEINSNHYKTTSSDFGVPCNQNVSSAKDLLFSGYTQDGGWSTRTAIRFNEYALDNVDSELEVWETDKHGLMTFTPRLKIDKKIVTKLYLLVCSCTLTCDALSMRCSGMRKIEYKDGLQVNLNFQNERVALLVLTINDKKNSMSDWVGCAYNNRSENPYREEPNPKTQKDGYSSRIYLTIPKRLFLCGPKLKKPVHVLYIKRICDSKPFVDRMDREIGAQEMKIPASHRESTTPCDVQLSYDNLTFHQAYVVPDNGQENGNLNIIIIILVVVVLICVIAVLAYAKRRKLRKCGHDFCKNIYDNPPPPGNQTDYFQNNTKADQYEVLMERTPGVYATDSVEQAVCDSDVRQPSTNTSDTSARNPDFQTSCNSYIPQDQKPDTSAVV